MSEYLLFEPTWVSLEATSGRHLVVERENVLATMSGALYQQYCIQVSYSIVLDDMEEWWRVATASLLMMKGDPSLV